MIPTAVAAIANMSVLRITPAGVPIRSVCRTSPLIPQKTYNKPRADRVRLAQGRNPLFVANGVEPRYDLISH